MQAKSVKKRVINNNVKLIKVVLSAFLAVAAAAPSHLHHGHGVAVVDTYQAPVITKTHISEPVLKTYEKTVVKPELTVVETPTVHHVGNVVKSFPTAVSHQSQTIVHSKADVVEPIYKHGIQKTFVETPRIEKHLVHQQEFQTKTLLHASPAVHTKTLVHAEPALHTAYVEPALHKSYVAHAAPALHTSYVAHAAPAVHAYAAPVVKTLHAPALTKVVEAPLSYSHGHAVLEHGHGLPLTYNSPVSAW